MVGECRPIFARRELCSGYLVQEFLDKEGLSEKSLRADFINDLNKTGIHLMQKLTDLIQVVGKEMANQGFIKKDKNTRNAIYECIVDVDDAINCYRLYLASIPEV